jgi:hypothetical protein
VSGQGPRVRSSNISVWQMDISRRREEFIKSYILMRQMAETLETALRLLEEPVQIPNRLAVATYISGEVIFRYWVDDDSAEPL